MYKNAHAAIRKNPDHVAPVKKTTKKVEKKRWTKAKQSIGARKAKVEQKKTFILKKLGADD
jgi:hypothetical protein